MRDEAEQLEGLKAALADRYDIEAQIGRGGMATVFRARDLKHDRLVAIKVLHPELAATLGADRFLREIQIAAKLHHPHILMLIDSGEADGLLYYVMPLAEGETLRERLNREKQLPLEDALQIAREVADALSYAHDHGVIHRDVKPENIMLESGHAVVTDFGIARAISAAGGDRLTETGIAVGTPAYMSPEQAAGSTEVDQRSDEYELACVLYEMLAGEPPFTGPAADVVLRKQMTAALPDIKVVRAGLPPHVVAALSRALAKTPADRFKTAADFAAQLARAATHATAFGARPSAWSRTWKLVATAVAAVAVVVGGWWAFNALGSGADRIGWLAVLPPDNLTGDSTQEYFVAGMHDELIAKLSQIPDLDVISRTSAVQYRNTDKSIPQIARELNVDAVIESSVLRSGDNVRIQVQLIDAFPRERHLWNERYDRAIEDVLALHSEVALDVAEQIRVALTSQDESRLATARPVVAQAFDAYQRGQFLRRTPTKESFEGALEQFQRAIDIDPEYAAAYAALAGTYIVSANMNYMAVADAFPRARDAAMRALTLDDNLCETHLALGAVNVSYERDYEEGGRELRRASDLCPNNARAHNWYSQWLPTQHRYQEAIAHAQRALALDPLSLDVNMNLGRMYHFARQYDRAIEQFQRTLELNPDLAWAHLSLGATYLQAGMHDEGLAAIERGQKLAGRIFPLFAYAYALTGRRAEARQILSELEATEHTSAGGLALVHGALGDKDRAFALLDEAYASYDSWMFNLNYPEWDSLRDDPRFIRLLRRLGLPN